jgi:flavodoxin/Pyruvate/2-oxoacid:ferredoxin oxidoreductase delta subunit
MSKIGLCEVQEMKKVLIHYFSGTGNTYHMVKMIGGSLTQQGYEVKYNNIENEKKERLDNFTLHIFSYPIYAYGTPSVVLKYIKTLSHVNGCKTAIVCSCGGFEGQSLAHMTALLKRKGFDVFLTDAGIYPDNWTQVINPKDEETQKKILENADSKILLLSGKISKLEGSIKKCSIFNQIWSWVVFLLFVAIGRRILGKAFIADSSCTSCGKCQKACPVKSVQLKNGNPKWDWKCENCQRCMNICPFKSIQTSPFKLGTFFTIEIALIFFVKAMNSSLHFPVLLNILLYCILIVISHYLIDIILGLLEKIPAVKSLFAYSYTKKYRRYMVNEFKAKL